MDYALIKEISSKMDVEEFIELVKKHPCLYDYRTSINTNRKVKEKIWKDIAKKMEITSELAKNKWKNLRDNYTKHLKSTTAISGPYLKYLHWSWARNMEFMKKYLNLSSAASTNQNNQEDDQSTENMDSSQSSSKSSDLHLNYKKSLKRHKTRQDDFAPEIMQYSVNNQDNGYDATDLIFLGYAKAIKSFSVRRQAEIKLKFAKIITDEEVAHYEETSLYPESPGYYSHLPPSPQNDPLTPKIVQIKSE